MLRIPIWRNNYTYAAAAFDGPEMLPLHLEGGADHAAPGIHGRDLLQVIARLAFQAAKSSMSCHTPTSCDWILKYVTGRARHRKLT